LSLRFTDNPQQDSGVDRLVARRHPTSVYDARPWWAREHRDAPLDMALAVGDLRRDPVRRRLVREAGDRPAVGRCAGRSGPGGDGAFWDETGRPGVLAVRVTGGGAAGTDQPGDRVALHRELPELVAGGCHRH